MKERAGSGMIQVAAVVNVNLMNVGGRGVGEL